ncbi:hypothetical protein IW261DRAFT_1496971 [Armillaria novae-zelandiae]|uniref:DUF1766-domain-containing protein n=1 Tax=Armillaria novae-zelandiae TaxID=153914 RepID=A0AA39NZI0_9AGAR|nr:hypothetical protein IW261DRAFT_1496971 [Armillaria novae-zelandiae]
MGRAKQFIAQIFDLEERRPSSPRPAHSELPVEAFNNLTIHEPLPSPARTSHATTTPFVGGFQPLPRPPAMQMPQPAVSLTMRHALNVPEDPPRAHSAPEIPRRRYLVPSSTPVSPSPSARPSPPASEPKLGRPRALSTPPNPNAPPDTQCSGVTKAGRRCTRQVKNGGVALPGVERFCFQHTKELLDPTGFYARRKGVQAPEWVEFADYIPSYLHPDAQVALRVEMEKARSQSDVEGYIYTFEIRDPDDNKTVQLKVGRAVNVVKRLNEWGKQCGSKEQVLRGFYPGSVGDGGDETSLMKGRVILPEGGNEDVWCHRLERLIHLELADLAVNAAYLQPGWKPFSKGKGKGPAKPKAGPRASTESISTSVASPKKRGGRMGNGNGGQGQPCKDCGTIHKEIFEFQRILSGQYKGREWDCVVKKVIEDWGVFVRTYV